MSDRPHSAAIRRPIQLTPALCTALAGVVLGTGIAFGGLVLADRQEQVLEAQAEAVATRQEQLQDALRHASLTVPRLRLEELASLPLVPEYLQIARDRPDSIDARELKDYLQTVFDAALEETGFSRITLEDDQGGELVLARAAQQAGEMPSIPLAVEAIVPDFDGSGRAAGRLLGSLPESARTTLLPPSDTGSVEATASIGLAAGAPLSTTGIANSTRLLALLSGLGTCLLGFAAAALLKRSRPSR